MRKPSARNLVRFRPRTSACGLVTVSVVQVRIVWGVGAPGAHAGARARTIRQGDAARGAQQGRLAQRAVAAGRQSVAEKSRAAIVVLIKNTRDSAKAHDREGV